jgi:hypothetical protein
MVAPQNGAAITKKNQNEQPFSACLMQNNPARCREATRLKYISFLFNALTLFIKTGTANAFI